MSVFFCNFYNFFDEKTICVVFFCFYWFVFFVCNQLYIFFCIATNAKLRFASVLQLLLFLKTTLPNLMFRFQSMKLVMEILPV